MIFITLPDGYVYCADPLILQHFPFPLFLCAISFNPKSAICNPQLNKSEIEKTPIKQSEIRNPKSKIQNREPLNPFQLLPQGRQAAPPRQNLRDFTSDFRNKRVQQAQRSSKTLL